MKVIAYGLVLLSVALLSQSKSIVKREAVKDDLQKDVQNLREQAKKEIEKLKAEGKGALAVGISTVEKKLEDIEGQLEKLNPQTEVGKSLLHVLEGLAKSLETKLKDEIKKLSGSYYADDDLKKTLKEEADKLRKDAQAEIEKLKKEGKAGLAKGIETVEKNVEDLEKQLEALHPTTEVGKALLTTLEALMKKAETNLQAEIKKLSGSYYADEDIKNTLLIEGAKLKKMAQDEIEKLKKEGKTELAAGIQAVEKRVVDIEAQLEKLNPTTEIGKSLLHVLEGLLKGAQSKLEDEIKKLSGSY